MNRLRTAPLRTARRRLLAAFAALTLAASVAACGGSGANASGEEVTTIRYQSYAGAVDAFLLADALGKFEGLTLDRVGDVTGGPQALQALASNQTDIGSSAFYGAIAQLVATGAPIKAVIPFYGSNADSNQKLVVRDESPIASAKDLIGKKIAVNTLGANAEAVLDTWFDQEGLSDAEQDKITLVPLPPLNTPEALGKGQVDAAVVSFLGYQATAKQFKVRELTNDVEVVGSPYAGGGLTLRNEFIEKNPNTTRQLVEGVAAAIEFIETHEKQEIFDVYFPYLEKEGYGDYIEPIKANFPGTLGLDPKPVIADEDIKRWVDWLDSRGDVDGDDLDVSDVYTNEFNPNA
ncbi:ABC transporter substrate-binding protein [Mumia zhuanghuii]|uniref:ABC transporter substrate-binding protein n=2 Tax=Mumia TaxID=1546255 RepID=A0ABW1QND1_9ACTN|nr:MULTISPECIES: ABC transporter substrate-binding protein [Mumia]KAA1423878.1 ABC transporter substrate-binding protein [Mumia zhuanghuii]